MAARSVVPSSEAPAFLARARDLLRATDAITLSDGTRLPIDDAALAARLDGVPAVEEAIAAIDARISAIDRASRPGALTGSNADARLAQILRDRAVAPASPSLLELVAGWIVQRIGDVVGALARAGVSVDFLPYAIAGVGLGAALIVLSIVGRGVRERIRREAVVRGAAGSAAADPATHLRLADAALAAGRLREALHELYLYALTSLTAHEIVRFDPALTDRELLARAAGIAEIGALRSLVTLHERVWFGLKPAQGDDLASARDLARRIAA